MGKRWCLCPRDKELVGLRERINDALRITTHYQQIIHVDCYVLIVVIHLAHPHVIFGFAGKEVHTS